MQLRWSVRASRHVDENAAYIARDNPSAAVRWIETIRERAWQVANYPQSGRMVPEYRREDLRELIEGNYRIVYRIRNDKDEIVIVGVYESHRLLTNPRRPGR